MRTSIVTSISGGAQRRGAWVARAVQVKYRSLKTTGRAQTLRRAGARIAKQSQELGVSPPNLLRPVTPRRDHLEMRRRLTGWIVAVAVAFAVLTISLWLRFGWTLTSVLSACTAVLLTLGALAALISGANDLLELLGRLPQRGPRRRRAAAMTSPEGRPWNFEWTPEARDLRATLGEVLWSQEDIDACVRASGIQMRRRPFTSNADNAWQSAIESAYASADPSVFESLLDEAATRHPAAEAAVERFRASR